MSPCIDRAAILFHVRDIEHSPKLLWILSPGVNKELRARGIQEGDTVVVGSHELLWSNDQSEGALYEAWKEERKGIARRGSARWPHAN